MIDSKVVVTQVQEMQVIIDDLLVEVTLLWKDFKSYLKHKCKEMIIENFIIRLRIEEDSKAGE